MLSIKNWEEYTYYLEVYLKEGNTNQFRFDFFQLHLNNRLDFFNTLNAQNRSIFYRLVEREELAAIISKLKPSEQRNVLRELSEDLAVDVIKRFPADELADFLGELSETEIDYYLNRMGKKESTQMKLLLSYKPNTAGAMLTTEYVTARRNETAFSVLDRLKVLGKDAESIYYIYIVTTSHQLIGVVSLRDVIMIKDGNNTMKKVMKEQVISVKPHTDQEEVVRLIKDYDLLFVPVVAEDNKLVGIVTVDDVMDAYTEETDKDFGEMAAVRGAIDLDISALQETKVRLPWLLILLLVGVIPAIVIANADFLSQEIMVLAIFIPLILGMAGNTGTQSLVAVHRGLVEKKFSKKSFLNVLKRQTITAFFMAIVCGFFGGLIAFLLTSGTYLMGIIIALAMFFSLVICTLTGSLIPFFVYRLKMDPAVASSPFVNAISDIVAIVIYFFVAWMVFNCY